MTSQAAIEKGDLTHEPTYKFDNVDLVTWTVLAIITIVIWFLGGWLAVEFWLAIYFLLAAATGLHAHLFESGNYECLWGEGPLLEIYIIISYWWAIWALAINEQRKRENQGKVS